MTIFGDNRDEKDERDLDRKDESSGSGLESRVTPTFLDYSNRREGSHDYHQRLKAFSVTLLFGGSGGIQQYTLLDPAIEFHSQIHNEN